MNNRCGKRTLFVVLLLVAAGGCSRKPSRILPPDLDPTATAKAAMALYDNNGDGSIDAEELGAAASLKWSLRKIDQDGDGSVSQQEIEQRISDWIDCRLGIMSVLCRVTLDGRLLSGATVTFDPESFVADAVKPASGTTDESGTALLAMDLEDRPHPNIMGLQVGLYRVIISKKQGDEETIPAKYNASTELGAEVASGAPGMNGAMRFNLTSR